MAERFPTAHKRTIAEIRCNLVHVDADSQAVTHGLSYPDINLRYIQPDPLTAGSYQVFLRSHDGAYAEYCNSGGPSSRESADPVPSIPAAWHPHKPFVAANVQDQVQIFDMSAYSSARNLQEGMHSTCTTSFVPEPFAVLEHELQKKVHCLSWRPLSGSQLAVGCVGGVALWHLSGSCRAPVGGSRGSAGGGPWMSFHSAPYQSGSRLTSLQWSPDGRLLAAASPDFLGLLLWDVAEGTCQRVGVGFTPIRMLRWSPDGSYLMAGTYGTSFYLFETSRWRYQSWDYATLGFETGAPDANGTVTSQVRQYVSEMIGSFITRLARSLGVPGHLFTGALGLTSPTKGAVADASWAPDSKILMMLFEGSDQVITFNLVGEAPSLTAQMMPMSLPEIRSSSKDSNIGSAVLLDASSAEGKLQESAVTSMAWDVRGERLTVLLRAPPEVAGCVAIFSTSIQPVVQSQLIGLARPPPGFCRWSAIEDWRLSTSSGVDFGSVISLKNESNNIFNLPLRYNM
ncbi:hypothetical protein CEUSTIGMA_g2542.t1 [Chlamydomonas eustigma]|uniref:Anaphase-promoting complex subunit 4 WD40 domain-containing protein n=1 Tax=Chlamydomonas eustigma TaxID=1157962 RepID=A0A250WW86_9CHLO|nr:hypothetical protein CEUSTIGMA_g2542.t1 [Chlamydomonas eustigma]|eukprot:GAX75098.1 hypothetical protein CEUSTIGMA_g2542.t1 [Chlamydomonas eustigma]